MHGFIFEQYIQAKRIFHLFQLLYHILLKDICLYRPHIYEEKKNHTRLKNTPPLQKKN